MSYFSPDVIILILGPWIGIFYYSVDLWWVSDPVWGKGFSSVVFQYKREEEKSGVLVLIPSSSGSRLFFQNG